MTRLRVGFLTQRRLKGIYCYKDVQVASVSVIEYTPLSTTLYRRTFQIDP